jgi:hypothetical protein
VDKAARRLFEAGQQAQQRGLAGAVRAHQANARALRDGEIDAGEDIVGTVGFGELGGGEDGHWRLEVGGWKLEAIIPSGVGRLRGRYADCADFADGSGVALGHSGGT